jgi:hypothetical protein
MVHTSTLIGKALIQLLPVHPRETDRVLCSKAQQTLFTLSVAGEGICDGPLTAEGIGHCSL